MEEVGGSNPSPGTKLLVSWMSGLNHFPAKKEFAVKAGRGFESLTHCQCMNIQ